MTHRNDARLWGGGLCAPIGRIVSKTASDDAHAEAQANQTALRRLVNNAGLGNSFNATQFLLNSKCRELDNLQVRYLIQDGRTIPFGGIQRKHADEAIGNLHRLAFVGTVETFEQSFLLLRRRFALPYCRTVTTNTACGSSVPKDSRLETLIEELNEQDLRLYSYFEQHLAERPSSMNLFANRLEAMQSKAFFRVRLLINRKLDRRA